MSLSPPTEPTPVGSPLREGRSELRLRLALLALALGGFTIGTTEFMTMGLLPEVAAGVDVSIPTAGHLISAYALGVVVGAPLLAVLGARAPRRRLLVWLMAGYAVANLFSAAVSSVELLALARFVDGLPHGAYFGVASLVAADLARPGRQGRAVAQVMLGLSVANVVGVPAATWLGQELGWRAGYLTASVLAVVTMAAIALVVPPVPGNPDAVWRRELSALAKPQVLLALAAGAVGFGGMFAIYTYISPIATDVAGLSRGAVPVVLLVLGLGMVVGTWVAGAMADWSVRASMVIGSLGMALALVLFWFVAPFGWALVGASFLVTVLGSLLVINLQLRLMDVSGEAQTLGAAMNHASLNVANALGAWIGGAVISAGYGLRAPALAGAALSLVGLLVLVVALRADRPGKGPSSGDEAGSGAPSVRDRVVAPAGPTV